MQSTLVLARYFAYYCKGRACRLKRHRTLTIYESSDYSIESHTKMQCPYWALQIKRMRVIRGAVILHHRRQV